MVLDDERSKLVPCGFKFRNHVGAPGEGAAKAFGLSNAVIVPAQAVTIMVGGKIGLRADDTAPKDLEEEMEQAFENVLLSLKACGLGQDAWEYVYKELTSIYQQMRTYSTPGDEVFEVLLKVARRRLKETRPAWTAVAVQTLLHPDAHIELEVEAYIPPSRASL